MQKPFLAAWIVQPLDLPASLLLLTYGFTPFRLVRGVSLRNNAFLPLLVEEFRSNFSCVHSFASVGVYL